MSALLQSCCGMPALFPEASCLFDFPHFETPFEAAPSHDYWESLLKWDLCYASMPEA